MGICLIALLVCGWFFGWDALSPADSSHSATIATPPAKASLLAGPLGRPLPHPVATTRPASPPVCASNPPGVKAVVVSISRQSLWACEGPETVNTSRVTTGAEGATPTGTFHVQAKEGPQYLNGCDARGCWHQFVHVWIPFDGSYGFHDATWQTMPFGSPEYTVQGSHGCIHLPAAESQWLYSWISVGTTTTIQA